MFLFLLWDIQDYSIANDTAFSYNGINDVTLDVIVYQPWKTQSIGREIGINYAKLNGIPTKLTINMYHSLCGKNKGKKPFKIIDVMYN